MAPSTGLGGAFLHDDDVRVGLIADLERGGVVLAEIYLLANLEGIHVFGQLDAALQSSFVEGLPVQGGEVDTLLGEDRRNSFVVYSGRVIDGVGDGFLGLLQNPAIGELAGHRQLTQ